MPRLSNNPDPPAWNIGYTTRHHLCLDLDNTSINKVFGLTKMLQEYYPYVGDALIMVSSMGTLKQKYTYPPGSLLQLKTARNNYHVIFNNFIDYKLSCHIIETLAYLGVINIEYIRIRSMRNDMTLRVSNTVNMDYTKPAPYPLGFVINEHCDIEDGAIFIYLDFLLNCLEP